MSRSLDSRKSLLALAPNQTEQTPLAWLRDGSSKEPACPFCDFLFPHHRHQDVEVRGQIKSLPAAVRKK